MNRRRVQRPRLLPALLALPFAALTAIEGAAAANLGYRFQPDWLVLAMITACLTFGLTGFAMARSRHAWLHGLVLGVCLIGEGRRAHINVVPIHQRVEDYDWDQ